MGKFRYRIESTSLSGGGVNIEAPDGWKDDESIFKRSSTYKGVFRSFSANELDFKGIGAQTLRDIFKNRGFESEAEYFIYETDFDPYTEFLRFKGNFDFVKFKQVNGNEGKKVSITVIDSAFWSRIKNREKIKPQLNQLTSLDGLQISGFANEEQFITIPEVPKKLGSFVSTERNSSVVIEGEHSSPLSVVYNEEGGGATNVNPPYTSSSPFYSIPANITKITLNLIFQTNFVFTDDDTEFQVVIEQKRSTASIWSEQLVFVAKVDEGDVITVNTSDTFEREDVQEGDTFLLYVKSVRREFKNQAPYIASTEVLAEVFTLPESSISGWLVHEALSRSLQLTSNTDIPLYTDLFGRKNSEPRSYAENGELSGILLTNGKRIRGFTREEAPISAGFRDQFLSLNGIIPICTLIEKINGVDNVRIEKEKYAYDDRVVLTIENASNIVESVFEDKIISRISVGYKKAEYEEKDGLFEYNQKSEFSTPVSVIDKNYDITAIYRADDQGIGNARAKSKTNFPTEDTRYDIDNFFIKVIQNDTELLNGNFESWINDNIPEYWIINQGTVERKFLLNSNRCYFQTSGVDGIVSIEQSEVFPQGYRVNVKMSYNHITDIPPGVKVGILPISPYFHLKLNTGSTIYYADAAGNWIQTATPQYIPIANNLEATKEAELQEFFSFTLNSQSTPEQGNIILIINSKAGFVVDDVFLGQTQYIAETNENFTDIENAVNGDRSLNLGISPVRNLLRHGNIIRIGLENSLNKKIKFNTSDKDSSLRTKKIGETEFKSEREDITIADLEEPYLSPVKIEFDLIVDKPVIDILNSTFDGETKPKYLGLIKFRQSESQEYRYVWLDELKTGGQSGLGKLTGIEISKYVAPIET